MSPQRSPRPSLNTANPPSPEAVSKKVVLSSWPVQHLSDYVRTFQTRGGGQSSPDGSVGLDHASQTGPTEIGPTTNPHQSDSFPGSLPDRWGEDPNISAPLGLWSPTADWPTQVFRLSNREQCLTLYLNPWVLPGAPVLNTKQAPAPPERPTSGTRAASFPSSAILNREWHNLQ